MPSNLGCGSLDWVRILENHHSLGRNVLRQVLWRLTYKVLLEEINLIILLDAFSGSQAHFLSSLSKA